MKPLFPAIWVKFTPYLVTWAEGTYGTAIELNGHHVLELRRLPGVKNALRRAVDEDLRMELPTINSISQQRYEVTELALRIKPKSVEIEGLMDAQELPSFLPVHVPNYLLTENGVLRPFSRIMQLRRTTASYLAGQVYKAFWNEVHHFAQSDTFEYDRDMLETFCEEHGIPSLHIDDLRNQYQRMKRRGYFVKKH